MIITPTDIIENGQPMKAALTDVIEKGRSMKATLADIIEKGRLMKTTLTGIIQKEDDIYVALCLELDVASQGYTVDEACKNLAEALELFFERASPEEVKERLSAKQAQEWLLNGEEAKEWLSGEWYITPIELAHG